MDPGADEDDVAVGTRLELPLWLVHNLAVRGFVSLRCAPLLSCTSALLSLVLACIGVPA